MKSPLGPLSVQDNAVVKFDDEFFDCSVSLMACHNFPAGILPVLRSFVRSISNSIALSGPSYSSFSSSTSTRTLRADKKTETRNKPDSVFDYHSSRP